MDDVREKVNGALGRFEQVLAETEGVFAALMREASKSAQLSAEKERLEGQLRQLRARAEELARVNREALAHVDTAMNRIRQVLGEG